MTPIEKFSGIAATNFNKVDDILAANIAGIDDITLDLGTVNPLFTLDLENYTVGSPFSPTGIQVLNAFTSPLQTVLASQLVNANQTAQMPAHFAAGVDTGSGIAPWSLTTGGTPSSATGPTGGVTTVAGSNPVEFDGTHDPSSKYMFAETSTAENDADSLFVFFISIANISSLMTDTSNPLELEFWYHGYSSNNNMGDLKIYATDPPFTNSSVGTILLLLGTSEPTLLYELSSSTINSQFTSQNDPWKQAIVDISSLVNSENGINNYHMIQFHYGNYGQNNPTNVWQSDFCIDSIRIREIVPLS